MGPLTGCKPFCILWNTLQTRWFIEPFCRILSVINSPASCSIFFDKFSLFSIYCSKLSVLIFSCRLVLSYQLDFILVENSVLDPPGHKYNLEDIIVFQTWFLSFLIRQFSEVSDIAALSILCIQTFYTKGKKKLLNFIYNSFCSFYLRYSLVKGARGWDMMLQVMDLLWPHNQSLPIRWLQSWTFIIEGCFPACLFALPLVTQVVLNFSTFPLTDLTLLKVECCCA